MADRVKTGFEPWAWGAFVLAGLVASIYLYLGLRPGGRGPILAYSRGLPILGVLSGLWMAVGMIWSVLHKPVLQRGRLKALVAAGASLWMASLPIAYPSSYEGKPSSLAFRLPFEGERSVRWGGLEREQNALIFDPARRFGVVFEQPQDAPSTEILAPAAGELRAWVQVESGGVWSAVLEVGLGRYLVLSGLAERGAAPGARIEAGAGLGRSLGSTLTVHLEDRPEPGRGEGIPFYFRDFRAGETHRERGVPVRGERVRQAGAESSR
jgi:hypothetical protein